MFIVVKYGLSENGISWDDDGYGYDDEIRDLEWENNLRDRV